MYTGKVVTLRAIKKDDIPLAQAFLNDPSIKVNLTPGVPYPFTLEDEEKWFASNSATKDTYSFAIETLETKEFIGACGLNEIDWKNRNALIGIFIGNHEYLGKGYGTDAMRVLIGFIFNEMNIHKIALNVYDFNERAIGCYKKCGFVIEGILRQQVFKGGRYCDEIRMGLLRDEWKGEK